MWVLSLGPIGLLQNTSLFYLLATFLFELSHNVVIIIKILGPILFGILAFTIYLYARKVLHWDSRKSLMVSIFMTIFFVSLRESWDLYRQTLGIVFLMAALISLASLNSPRRYYVVSFFMVLAVFSHERVSAILFFIVAIESLRLLIKKSRKDYLSFSFGSFTCSFIFISKILASARYEFLTFYFCCFRTFYQSGSLYDRFNNLLFWPYSAVSFSRSKRVKG